MEVKNRTKQQGHSSILLDPDMQNTKPSICHFLLHILRKLLTCLSSAMKNNNLQREKQYYRAVGINGVLFCWTQIKN